MVFIYYYFELMGIFELKVIMRFWIGIFIFGIIVLGVIKMRGIL